MEKQSFSFRKRLKSVGFALSGFVALVKAEHNAWIHVAATLAVIISGLLFKLNSYEWIAVFVAIAIVFITEIFNTAIEKLCDFVSPGYDPRIGKIKDIAAAAVLLSATIAIIIGVFVFLPKILA